MQGNLLLDRLFGAEIHLVRSREECKRTLEELVAAARARGERPYAIPTGGSTPVGVAAYVRAAFELAAQLVERGVAASRLLLATSTSGGTQAGLVLGAVLWGQPFRVVGIAVQPDAATIRQRVAELANATADLLEVPVRITPEMVEVDDRWVGPGHGVPEETTIEALQLAAR